MSDAVTACPVHRGIDPARDDRKSAAIAAANVQAAPGAVVTGNFAFAREVLRNPAFLQAGAGAERIDTSQPDRVPLFFLDGEVHKKRRGNLARFFTPKAIKDRHRKVMEATTAELMAELRATGRQRLDLMSMKLASDVAAEIVGLTNSDPKALADRLRLTFLSIGGHANSFLGRVQKGALSLYKTFVFYMRDVRPAIRERRKRRRDDVISYLIDEGFTDKQILIECMTYATAGVLTTREYIVMVAWHLFERDDLRELFLNGDEDVQFAILDEVLRLEPVAALLHRKAASDLTGPNGETVKAGELHAVNMRAANTDEAATGPCPFAIDPQRSKRERMPSNWMSFGDGPHRCPGSQVALHETRVFIDALLRVPGIRLANAPTVGWCAPIMGYELHGAFVECDKG